MKNIIAIIFIIFGLLFVGIGIIYAEWWVLIFGMLLLACARLDAMGG